MTDAKPQWTLGGEDIGRIPPGVKALAEHLLTENDGEAVAALLEACFVIAAVQPAISRGMVRNGSVAGVNIADALDIVSRGRAASA